MPYMSLVALIIALIGAGVSAYSSYQQGQAQSAMANYNALIARQNADLTAKQMELQKGETDIAVKRHRAKTERTKATQRALFGKAGVEAKGSPLLLAEETATEAELDALVIRYAGSREQANILAQQAGFEQEAIIQRMRGTQARRAGTLGAGSTLLTGLGRTFYPKIT